MVLGLRWLSGLWSIRVDPVPCLIRQDQSFANFADRPTCDDHSLSQAGHEQTVGSAVQFSESGHSHGAVGVRNVAVAGHSVPTVTAVERQAVLNTHRPGTDGLRLTLSAQRVALLLGDETIPIGRHRLLCS